MGFKNLRMRKTINTITKDILEDTENSNWEQQYRKFFHFAKLYMGKQFSDFDHFLYVSGDDETSLNKYFDQFIHNTDPVIFQTLMNNFVFYSLLYGSKRITKMRKIHGCNIPWCITIEPEQFTPMYENLSFENIDDIVKQGRDLGIHFFIFLSEEPLEDYEKIFNICENNKDCEFLLYINTLPVSDRFCEKVRNVGNLIISLKYESNYDEKIPELRISETLYNSLELLRKWKLVFGVSINYNANNYKEMVDSETISFLVNKGCRFAHYSPYMDKNAIWRDELIPNEEQTSYVNKRVKEIRDIVNGERLFTVSIPYNAECNSKCRAGSRKFIHIKADGYVGPCFFTHYARANIYLDSLLDILSNNFYLDDFNNLQSKPCSVLDDIS